MLLSERLMPILAEYSFDVLRVFEKAEIFIASEAYRYGQGTRTPGYWLKYINTSSMTIKILPACQMLRAYSPT